MVNKKSFNLFEYHYKLNRNILISYKGPFDNQIMGVIGDHIRLLIAQSREASKKLFKIFIELAQNVSYYSSERNSLNKNSKAGVGNIIIVEYPDHFSFSSGNIVKKTDLDSIISKCKKINSLDKDGLREYKRQELRKPSGERGGGNIGLIKVALTSTYPLEVNVHNVDNCSTFFSLDIRIDK